MARLVVDHPDRWARPLRVGSLFLLSAMGGLAIWMGAQGSSQRERALAALPPAAADAPNVLLIVLDAARADALSSYGYPLPTTPTLDAVASEGALFELAMATAPWTLPSHITMFSGRYVLPDGGGNSTHFRRPMGTEDRVLAETFGAAGYETAGFVANFYYTGRDTGLARGFIHYRDYIRTLGEVLLASTFGQTALARRLAHSRSLGDVWRVLLDNDFSVETLPVHAKKTATRVTDEFLAFLEDREPRPFFTFLNYIDVHLPYEPPPPFDRRFPEVPHQRHLYDGAMAYIDSELSRIVDRLRERGEMNRTVIVVTGDHGELFGEHGLFEHTSNLYLPVLHVPLIVRFPSRVAAGQRVGEAVSLRDLAATLVDLSGVAAEVPYPGVSLGRLLTDGGTDRVLSPVMAAVEQGIRTDTTLPFTKGPMQTLVEDGWHFIRTSGTDLEELYDYRSDPVEANDLLADSTYHVVASRLRRKLDRLIELGPAGPPNRLEPPR